MSDFTVKSNLNHDGVEYAPGATVELSEETAEGLLRDGVIVDPNASSDGDGERENTQPAVKTTSREGDDVDGEQNTEEGADTDTANDDDDGEGDGEGKSERKRRFRKGKNKGSDNDDDSDGDNL